MIRILFLVPVGSKGVSLKEGILHWSFITIQFIIQDQAYMWLHRVDYLLNSTSLIYQKSSVILKALDLHNAKKNEMAVSKKYIHQIYSYSCSVSSELPHYSSVYWSSTLGQIEYFGMKGTFLIDFWWTFWISSV